MPIDRYGQFVSPDVLAIQQFETEVFAEVRRLLNAGETDNPVTAITLAAATVRARWQAQLGLPQEPLKY